MSVQPCFLFASNNAHKFEEAQNILSDIPLVSPNQLGIRCDPEETGSTFFENAYLKAQAFYNELTKQKTHSLTKNNFVKIASYEIRAVLSEDSGICVDALDGKPGIHSARYGFSGVCSDGSRIPSQIAKSIDNKEHAAHAHSQCHLLQYEIAEKANRSAHFTCCAVLLTNLDEYMSVQSIWKGSISKQAPQGMHGFGYDPIFIAPEHNCLSSQLTPQQKNQISHRAKALQALRSHLHTMLTHNL